MTYGWPYTVLRITQNLLKQSPRFSKVFISELSQEKNFLWHYLQSPQWALTTWVNFRVFLKSLKIYPDYLQCLLIIDFREHWSFPRLADWSTKNWGVIIHLGQAFWHQEVVAVIDGWLWELEWHLWEGITLIGWHGNSPVRYMAWTHDTWTVDICYQTDMGNTDNIRVPSRM